MAEEQVIRRLTLKAEAEGVDKARDSVRGLSDAAASLATVTDTNAKRALSAESAFKKLANQIDDAAYSASAIERGVRTLDAALAQGIITQDKYNESLGQLKEKYTDTDEANEKLSDGFKVTGVEAASVANHIKNLVGIAYVLSPAFREMANPLIAAGLRASGSALAAMSPFAAAIAASLAARVLPLMAQVAAFALPFALLSAEIKLIGYAWDSAQERIASYIKISKEALGAGVSADFWQRWGAAAKEAGFDVNSATEALKKFADVSKDQLGGSDLQKKLDSHLVVGNVTAKQLVPFSLAAGTEEKMRAMTVLLDQMVNDGKKLAAIDIVKTFAPPEVTEAFRQNTEYFKEIQSKAAAISATKLVSQEDINDAAQLSNRYDEAVKILSERWIPFQKTITDGGQEIYRVWVGIVELLAKAVTAIVSFASTVADLIGSIPHLGTAIKAAAESAMNVLTFGAYGVGKSAASSLASPSSAPQAGYAALASGLSNPSNVKSAQQQTLDTYGKVFRDTSKSLDKREIEESSDAVDRAINSIRKHIEVQKADAEAVGQSVGAHARLRVAAAETAAVMANGGKQTDAQREAFRKLKDEAESAATALERAKVANDIKRQRDSLFLTDGDVAIANQLKGLYADIPTALQSAEAEQIRFNNLLKDMNDTVKDGAKSFARDFISGLKSGKSLMDSLGDAAQNLSKKLLDSGIDDLFSGNFISGGIKIAGSFLAGLFGESDEEKAAKEAARKAEEERQRKIEAGKQRASDFTFQAQLASVNTDTIAGQIQAFDIQATKARADELKAGGEAILELEKKLAAERQSIVDKANKQVLKSYNDFLDSIKTGSLSTLSPEDQLKFAQSKFDADVAAAKNGDAGAIDRVTADAQSLLDIAKSFYASTSGYTSIYQSVTDAITGLANGNALFTAPTDTNIITSKPVSSDSYGPESGRSFLGGFSTEVAAVLPGYASGGVVMNGMRGTDSVTARLAGGEFMTKTSSVNSSTLGALQYINQTGRAPRSNGDGEVARILTQGFNGQTTALVEALGVLTDRVKRVEDATRQASNQRRVPGSSMQKAA